MQGPTAKTLQLNALYLIVFANLRDKLQVSYSQEVTSSFGLSKYGKKNVKKHFIIS